MYFKPILKILGLLLMIFSIALLLPVIVNFIYLDGNHYVFLLTFYITFLTGFCLWLPCRKTNQELRTREGFVVTVFLWLVLSLYACIPFLLSEKIHLNFASALFESVSGLTTTGSTVIANLNVLPHDILFYRQLLQFFGGMGIIILAVAILPMLRIGGMQLFKTEVTGISKDNKLTPKITQTAKALWAFYLCFHLLCILSFYIAGMDLFNAICYAFGTVSTGGFAPHNSSIGHFHNNLYSLISIFFMLVGAINFSLHFFAFRYNDFKIYFKDPECQVYLIYIVASILFVAFFLRLYQYDLSLTNVFIKSCYQVISIATTTGMANDNFAVWPMFLPVFIIYLGIIGGCAGSTSGGLKFVRILLLSKQGLYEIKHLIHPQGKFLIKYGNKNLEHTTVNSVWGFIACYIALYIILLLILLALGMDFTTSFSASASALSNIGPGLGAISENYSTVNNEIKLLLSFAMIIGRLEIFTVLILFVPDFWKY